MDSCINTGDMSDICALHDMDRWLPAGRDVSRDPDALTAMQ